MRYRLVYTHRASKDIRRLEENAKQRIGKALKRYGEEPLKYASKLTDPALGTYRFRIGDYRVIFDIEDKEIVVLRVGHRRDIYRKL
ncbi:type II toxin-antitoxin system RelE/ParE family toxin [Candidatus Bathyarchaeota archaeon]|nr:type II toxin-antitoxin system RelE/ParE family toxin [Candidatus Bathyarchaeota archaeon]